MVNNNPFYVCASFCLLIYSTEEIASKVRASKSIIAAGYETNASSIISKIANYWSQALTSKVQFSNPGEPIFVISKKDKLWNVIIGERIGWIIAADWLKLMPLEKL